MVLLALRVRVYARIAQTNAKRLVVRRLRIVQTWKCKCIFVGKKRNYRTKLQYQNQNCSIRIRRITQHISNVSQRNTRIQPPHTRAPPHMNI